MTRVEFLYDQPMQDRATFVEFRAYHLDGSIDSKGARGERGELILTETVAGVKMLTILTDNMFRAGGSDRWFITVPIWAVKRCD